VLLPISSQDGVDAGVTVAALQETFPLKGKRWVHQLFCNTQNSQISRHVKKVTTGKNSMWCRYASGNLHPQRHTLVSPAFLLHTKLIALQMNRHVEKMTTGTNSIWCHYASGNLHLQKHTLVSPAFLQYTKFIKITDKWPCRKGDNWYKQHLVSRKWSIAQFAVNIMNEH
jgi:hypothetical protein